MGKNQPFSMVAANYDRNFTDTMLGRMFRSVVWSKLDKCFSKGQHLIELGCGTGEDALYLAKRGIRVFATDISREMIRETNRKISSNGFDRFVRAEQIPIQAFFNDRRHLNNKFSDDDLRFDGVLSNFGVLNCISDLKALSIGLAGYLKPGAKAIFCIMGPVVIWEWIWFLRKGEPMKAFRRLKKRGVKWKGVAIKYPGIRAVRKAFLPSFKFISASGLGIFLPPTYVKSWADKHPGTLRFLERMERKLDTLPPFYWMGDHYIIIMERK